MPKNIRQPAVAGQFYPVDEGELREMVNEYLKDIKIPLRSLYTKGVRAVIVPHAGYVFSGSVAAHAYKQIEGMDFKRVILISNSHTSFFKGVAVDDHDIWRTPLGEIEVDKNFINQLVKESKTIKINAEPHLSDHNLEVQLPFLQIVLKKKFKIVPIEMGSSDSDDYKKLANVLAKNLEEDDLVIISSDLSHYPSYENAERIDKETLNKIASGNIGDLENYIKRVEEENIFNEQTLACGIDAIKTVIELSNILGWQAEVLKYANSGDSPYGDRKSVVGYGAIAYAQTQNSKRKIQNYNSKLKSDLNEEQKKLLLQIAKLSIESYVRTGKAPGFEISDERLNWKEGAFVTLKKNGGLRGCIGQIIPTEKPLWQVVRDMAISAATEDDRFNPVSENELPNLEYEISVLSKSEKVNNWREIELSKHGVIIKKGMRAGVFLPQVAEETGWSKEEFLSQLCSQKAGLPSDCYKDKDTEISVFTAQVF